MVGDYVIVNILITKGIIYDLVLPHHIKIDTDIFYGNATKAELEKQFFLNPSSLVVEIWGKKCVSYDTLEVVSKLSEFRI